MKIITHSQINSLSISGSQMLRWVDQALKEKSMDILPPKTSISPETGEFFNFMPTILSTQKVAGIKVVNRYPNRVPVLDSQILIYDLLTGHVKALMDGNYITTARTGAVAVHSIQLFAVENFMTVSFIGLGNQARAVIKVLADSYQDQPFIFKLKKYKNQHLVFKDFIKKNFKQEVSVQFFDTYEETIYDSDVVVSSVTYFDKDIIEDPNIFKPGALLVPIHTRGFMKCDLEFEKVFADDKSHVEKFKYFDSFKKFGEVSDVLLGKMSGRENNDERIIVYNIGLAIHDIYFANKIFELLSDNPSTEVNLSIPTEKFWFE